MERLANKKEVAMTQYTEVTNAEVVARLQRDILEMKADRLKHYREGLDGRLNVDDTKRMIKVAEAEIVLRASFARLSHQIC